MNLVSQNASSKGSWSNFFKSPVDWYLVVGLLGLAPLALTEARALWSMKHYQFFPLAWIAFAAIVYLRGHLATPTNKTRLAIGWLTTVGTITFAALAVLLLYPKVAQIASIGVIFSWMLLRLGGNRWFEVFAWTTLLVITVRLPVVFDQTLIHWLQSVSSQSASHLLDLTGIPHLATGNVIEIRPGKLFVEEACSGVDSFYALCAVALMLAVWQQRGFLVSILTILSVPLWAWFGNLIRLYLLAYLYNNWDINLTEGWTHTVLGLAIFGIAFGGMLSMQEAFTRLLAPLPGGDTTSDWAPRLYNWLVAWPGSMDGPVKSEPSAVAATGGAIPTIGTSENRPSLLSWVVPGIGILVFLVGGIITAGPALGFGSKRIAVPRIFDRGTVDLVFAADQLPENLGGMKRKGFEISHREQNSMFGAHSATWVFQDQSREVVLSLDFLFTVFHPLEVCYISTGSTVLGDIIQHETVSDGKTQFTSEVNLRDLFGEQSFLLYTEFNQDGESAERIEVFSITTFFNKGIFEKSIGPLYQLQLLASDGSQLTDQDKARYRDILHEARQMLLPRIQQLTKGGSTAAPTGGSATTETMTPTASDAAPSDQLAH